MLQTIYFFLLFTKKNSILYLAGNDIVCNIYFILKQSNADLCWFKQDMKKATFSLVVEGFDRSINGSVKIQGISACNYVWIYKNAHVLFLKSISTFFTLCNYKPFTLWATDRQVESGNKISKVIRIYEVNSADSIF